jgi:hypothetical protein
MLLCPKCKQPVVVPEGKDYVICCNEVIFVISDRDANVFFEEICNPSEPNTALKNAALQYVKNVPQNRKTESET